MIKAKAALVLTALIATTLFPSTANARDLAIWDQLQGTNPTGYVLLMRHALARLAVIAARTVPFATTAGGVQRFADHAGRGEIDLVFAAAER